MKIVTTTARPFFKSLRVEHKDSQGNVIAVGYEGQSSIAFLLETTDWGRNIVCRDNIKVNLQPNKVYRITIEVDDDEVIT